MSSQPIHSTLRHRQKILHLCGMIVCHPSALQHQGRMCSILSSGTCCG